MVALAVAATTGVTAVAQTPQHHVQLVPGSCDEPDGPATSLVNLPSDGDPVGAPVEMETVARALGSAVSSGHAAVPFTLSDITSAEHAVRIIERSRPPGRPVACGEFGVIDGTVSDLHVGLAPVGDSGLQGVLWLHDNGDGTTGASVAIASQAPTTSSAARDGVVEVAIRKSLYVPNPLEIEAGTTVTWINEDVLPHTTTATDGAFDSGYMPLDASYSRTFETPGEYPIFCVYHPRMRAVVIVS